VYLQVAPVDPIIIGDDDSGQLDVLVADGLERLCSGSQLKLFSGVTSARLFTGRAWRWGCFARAGGT
jgi:hypothetical protein